MNWCGMALNVVRSVGWDRTVESVAVLDGTDRAELADAETLLRSRTQVRWHSLRARARR